MSEDFYFSLPSTTNKEEAVNSLLSSFVNAREQVKIPSLIKGFDEDVNLYIAHLLFAVSVPNYAAITGQYISLYTPEVRVLADMAEDLYLKYFIYKVNADNLLLHIGVYRDLLYKKPKKAMKKDIESYVKDAASFYAEAASLNKKIYKRKTAISEVLMKISKNIRYYLEALFYVRKDFFRFLNCFEDKEFFSFIENMKKYEKKVEFERKQDIFLDLYAKWLKKKSKNLKTEINRVCEDLRALDPNFNFKLN